MLDLANATNRPCGFKPKGSGSFYYGYDNAGNMTSDGHKDLTVAYNALNLPDVFTFANVTPNNKIEIVYNAAGEKLEKQVYTGATLSLHKRYVMGIEYTGTTLEAIYHAEGRIVPIGGGVFRYEYTLKDHLGNSRVSFAANGTAIQLLQENHYYPFGMEMKGAWIAQSGTENGYQYNGKELNEDWGLNWMDYGARWYDASVGRWNSIDPLAEKFVEWNPYNYVYNNPLIFTDPTGMSGDLSNGITIIFKKDRNLTNQEFLDFTMNYIINVMQVWGDDNKQDLSKVNFQVAIDDNFSAKDLGKNQNLVNVGDYGDDASRVTGKDRDVAYMNIRSTSQNTSAHEFGHHMGLADRYFEGVDWNQSSGKVNRRTTPMQGSEINDSDYDPADNLYSSGSSRLTPYQLQIANSSEEEPDYQKGRGILYNSHKNGDVIKNIPYRFRGGKVEGLPSGLGQATREKIKSKIKQVHK